jgi:hypothetical protein
MNNSTAFSWEGAYVCAVLETDRVRVARRIDDAMHAIEQRVGTTVRIDDTEAAALDAARYALAILRGEWFGGLAELIDGSVISHRETAPGRQVIFDLTAVGRGK